MSQGLFRSFARHFDILVNSVANQMLGNDAKTRVWEENGEEVVAFDDFESEPTKVEKMTMSEPRMTAVEGFVTTTRQGSAAVAIRERFKYKH